MGEVSNWIPTSFSGAGDGEGDSLCSFETENRESAEVATASKDPTGDLSFDLISRQKLSLTPRSVATPHDRLSPKGAPMALFEDDTRSSWSIDSSKNTFKETETPIKSDEDSRSSLSSHKCLKRKYSDDDAQPSEDQPSEELQLSEEPQSEELPLSQEQPPNFKLPEVDPSSYQLPEVEPSNFQLSEAKPSNFQLPEVQPSNFKLSALQPSEFQLPKEQSTSFQPSEEQSSSFQPSEEQSSSFQHSEEQSTSFPQSEEQSTSFPHSEKQSASFQHSEEQSASFQQSGEPSTSLENSEVQPTESQLSEESTADITTIPAENLCEYMWPTIKGEFFFLQEQISDYLSVKSFKRKYPDMQRRPVEADERDHLRNKGIVNETQCDLGLTAIKSDEVMELMNRDYPEKYAEYIRVLREKEKLSAIEKQKENAALAEKNRMEVIKKAIKNAAEYNAHLNQERKEERRCCIDLQTFTIHYPIGKIKVKKTVKMGKYPVALLPGQFQDSYKDYTSEELKYLPVNTVLYGPLQEIKTALSEGSHSDSEDSSASDGSCSSSQGTHDDGSGESSSGSERTQTKVTTKPLIEKVTIKTPVAPKQKEKPTCKVCKLGSGSGKDEKNEPLLQCSVCLNSGHPTCLELTLDMVTVLKTYAWQCMDCKTCVHCRDPYDEDKMLFCDICDRGYHTFCVGLKSLPQGKWICQLCGRCAVCNATQAGPEGSKAQWQYDTTKNIATNGDKPTEASSRHQVVCQSCFKSKNSN